MIKSIETLVYTDEKKLTIIESENMILEISSMKYDNYDETIIKDLGDNPIETIKKRPSNHDEAVKWSINLMHNVFLMHNKKSF